MARTVGIGIQDFGKIIENRYFYVDKTQFIKEWWENGDGATCLKDYLSGRRKSTALCRELTR